VTETATPAAAAELATHRLREANLRFRKYVSCEYLEGVLLLQGRVPTYYLKQIAQTVVARVPGVERVDNRIQVSTTI